MESPKPVLIDAQVWTDQNHRSAGRSDNIRNDRADGEKNDIRQRRRLPFDAYMDSARHHKQRADENDEAEIFRSGMHHPVRITEKEDVINDRNRSQRQRNVRIELLPPSFANERHNRNGKQKKYERNHHERIHRLGVQFFTAKYKLLNTCTQIH